MTSHLCSKLLWCSEESQMARVISFVVDAKATTWMGKCCWGCGGQYSWIFSWPKPSTDLSADGSQRSKIAASDNLDFRKSPTSMHLPTPLRVWAATLNPTVMQPAETGRTATPRRSRKTFTWPRPDVSWEPQVPLSSRPRPALGGSPLAFTGASTEKAVCRKKLKNQPAEAEWLSRWDVRDKPTVQSICQVPQATTNALFDLRRIPILFCLTRECDRHRCTPLHCKQWRWAFANRAANFRALLHRQVREVRALLPAVVRPILPWALFPFKVARISFRFCLAVPITTIPVSCSAEAAPFTAISLYSFTWTLLPSSRAEAQGDRRNLQCRLGCWPKPAARCCNSCWRISPSVPRWVCPKNSLAICLPLAKSRSLCR